MAVALGRRITALDHGIPFADAVSKPRRFWGCIHTMDWFERLTGFRELSYEETGAKLRVDGKRLHSLANRKSWAVEELEIVTLRTLRERAGLSRAASGRLSTSVVTGDVRAMHAAPEYAGALFQVASQFNALEMTSPEVTPENRATRYENDPTQGPACTSPRR
jgi:hypothetical protein